MLVSWLNDTHPVTVPMLVSYQMTITQIIVVNKIYVCWNWCDSVNVCLQQSERERERGGGREREREREERERDREREREKRESKINVYYNK